MTAKTWTAPEILQVSSSYWTACALQAGVSLDLFTTIDASAAENKALTVAELAGALACDGRAFGMLVTALVALGFLEREGEVLRLPEASARFLSQRSNEYLGFILKHHAFILPAWARLDEAVRTGRQTRLPTPTTENEQEREAFLMGMFNIATYQAGLVAQSLDLSGRGRLIDIGGGPGTYAVFFCQKNPALRATIFDLPGSRAIAEGVVKRYGLEDRIDFAGGDFLGGALPSGYDVAWLSQVLHGENPENAGRLVADAARTLNPGGLLVIQEFMLDENLSGPAHAALFSLNMLVGTAGGQSYTQAAIADMMRRAGAGNIRCLPVDLPQSCRILVGEMGA